ncbi:MAG TPA: NAD(P)/FAD-dependent oxidoreductase [Polyangiales bacterium]|nr:NAD(P)/FAD-dependent oxidoreductase [Polyangiales bacterium]
MQAFDAVVVGAGPNGLAAAVALARAGLSVQLIEAQAELGGGVRSAALTEPGFLHDVCSAVHPLGVLSPYLRTLPLAEHGLTWAPAQLSAAHPLDDGRALVLERSVTATAERLGRDARRYEKLLAPLVRNADGLLAELLGPLHVPAPRNILSFTRFGLYGLWPARTLARALFRDEAARALFAGCVAHSILPFEKLFTSAVGLLFLLTGHATDWPVVRGGSQNIARALGGLFAADGGSAVTSQRVTRLAELPEARAYLFDLAPRQLSEICGEALPASYRARLARYNYGPGVFKLDYALSGPIPWRNAECARASTVHVGGTLDEIAASERASFHGQHSERPFVMVCQQSHFDDTRAPAGKHTGYAYCHVPFGSTHDMTEAVERQIERFAPGFRDVVIARRKWFPADLERENPAHVGGVIAGGAADITQLFTRPVARLDPYTTPNPKLFLCSAATPPGGGVHGMCGYHAAQSVLRKVFGRR